MELKKSAVANFIKEWSNTVKDLGNESAHPQPGQVARGPDEARDVVRFLEFLLRYLYTLPHEIKIFREREIKSK